MIGASQKKLAVVNDFSGFGHCSLAVAMPVISVMGIQCCPVPTSVLSNHLGYPDHSFFDFTDQMEDYLDKWRTLDLKFDGICTGFLGSDRQAEIVLHMIDSFAAEGTKVIVDPVMGDHGRAYSSYTPTLREAMIKLIGKADIITPNLTECCLLTGVKYQEDFSDSELTAFAKELADMGPTGVVITGALDKEKADVLRNVVCDHGACEIQYEERIGSGRCGTGDIFAAIVAADAVHGRNLSDSVKKASAFISRCIRRSEEIGLSPLDGVCLEEFLGELR